MIIFDSFGEKVWNTFKLSSIGNICFCLLSARDVLIGLILLENFCCVVFPMLKNFKYHFCSRNAYLEQQNYICSLGMLFILRYKKKKTQNQTHLLISKENWKK